MSSVLLTVSAVIRTPCSTGFPPPALELPLSANPPNPVPAPTPAAFPAAVGVPPKPDPPKPDPPPPPVPERDPNTLDDEPPPPLLLFSDSRSPLDVEDKPDPGAIWLLALSNEAEDEPPMNISVSTRAIWRASPYFTR